MRAKSQICSLLILLLASIHCVYAVPMAKKDAELDDWIKEIKRPGWTLMVKAHEKKVLFAVFKIDGSSIAVCDKNTDETSRGYGTGIGILSADGHSITDDSRKQENITRDWRHITPGGWTAGTTLDGQIHYLLPYDGVITLRYDFRDNADEDKNVIIREKIPWHKQ